MKSTFFLQYTKNEFFVFLLDSLKPLKAVVFQIILLVHCKKKVRGMVLILFGMSCVLFFVYVLKSHKDS